MADLSAIQPLALAISCAPAHPDEVFATVEGLADAIVRRAGPQSTIRLGRAELGRRSGGAEALVVHPAGSAWPLGYALGLGHEAEALQAAINQACRRQLARAT